MSFRIHSYPWVIESRDCVLFVLIILVSNLNKYGLLVLNEYE